MKEIVEGTLMNEWKDNAKIRQEKQKKVKENKYRDIMAKQSMRVDKWIRLRQLKKG
jgi:hypothetical protein